MNESSQMTASRTSAQRKFDRGIEQIKQLRHEIEAFENGDAITVHTLPERKSETQLEVRCFAEQSEPTPGHWPLLAGEAVQNLRASLDHAVYDASGGNDKTQFPICTTPGKFRKESKSRLTGVPASFYESAERGQPYSWTPDHPKADALWLLAELSNADKHRSLATVVCAVRMESIGVAENVKMHWLEYGSGKDLAVGSNHLSTFLIHSHGGADIGDAEPRFGFQVMIERRPIGSLVAIAQHVHRVLSDCQTGEPLSPFAEYPIMP